MREALGPAARIEGLEPLSTQPGRAVLRVTVSGRAERLVVKVTTGPVAGRADDPERTAAATALASAAGVPTAEVLAARRAGDGAPGYLVQRHVDGVEWRRLRPTLDEHEVRSVHRRIAAAVVAVQTVRLPGFGDLGSADGAGLLAALHRRAERLVTDPDLRAAFAALLDREAALFAGDEEPTLVHDDLHSDNVVLAPDAGGWRLAGVLDWDKAWAGPAESDVARMAFWDGMTGPGFWEVYRAAVPEEAGWARRALVHQLLWCLEYAVPTERHRADTAAVAAALGLPR